MATSALFLSYNLTFKSLLLNFNLTFYNMTASTPFLKLLLLFESVF